MAAFEEAFAASRVVYKQRVYFPKAVTPPERELGYYIPRDLAAQERVVFVLPGRVLTAHIHEVNSAEQLAKYAATPASKEREVLLGPFTTVTSSADAVMVAPTAGGDGLRFTVKDGADRLIALASDLRGKANHNVLRDALAPDTKTADVLHTAIWERFMQKDMTLWSFYFAAADSEVHAHMTRRLVDTGLLVLERRVQAPGAGAALAEFLAAVCTVPGARALLLSFKVPGGHDWRVDADGIPIDPPESPGHTVHGDSMQVVASLLGQVHLNGDHAAGHAAMTDVVARLVFVANHVKALPRLDTASKNVAYLLKYPHEAELSAVFSRSEVEWFRDVALPRSQHYSFAATSDRGVFRNFENDGKPCAMLVAQVAAEAGRLEEIEAMIGRLPVPMMTAALVGDAPAAAATATGTGLNASNSAVNLPTMRQPSPVPPHSGSKLGMPAITLLLHPALRNEAGRFGRFCQLIKQRCPEMIDERLFTEFVHRAIATENDKLIQDFIEQVLLDEDTHDWNDAILKRIHAPGPILVQALAPATVPLESNHVRLIVEYILRLEHVGTFRLPRAVTTLRAWATGSPSRPSSARPSMPGTPVAPMHPPPMDDGRRNQIVRVLEGTVFANFYVNFIHRNANVSEPGTAPTAAPTGPVPAPRSRPPAAGAPSAAVAPTANAAADDGANAGFRSRSFAQLREALVGFLTLLVAVDPGKIVEFLEHSLLSDFLSTRFTGSIRNDVVAVIEEVWGMRPPFKNAALRGELFYSRVHFKKDALAVLSIPPRTAEDGLFTLIVLTAIKLQNYDDLPARLRAVEHSAAMSQEAAEQLTDICRVVLRRPSEDFLTLGEDAPAPVDLEQLSKCAYDASLAMEALPEGKASKRLKEMFNFYLRSKPPLAWSELFRSAETIASFIKYMDREDLQLAHTAFTSLNAKASVAVQAAIASAIAQYQKMMITVEQVPVEQGDAAVEQGIKNLEERANDAHLDRKLAWAMKLGAAWMRSCKKVIGIPMAPRNSQVLAFLSCLYWADAARPMASDGVAARLSSLIGQVGTGEGKSLIIAMLAVYVVKELGKKVHVMENNRSLLERDHATFREFYDGFGINSTMSFSDDAADICYCLRIDVARAYQRLATRGKRPLSDTFLIVDEVDELIVDESPNQAFVQDDVTQTADLQRAFNALADNAGKPPSVPQALWATAAAAAAEAAGMVLNAPDGYSVDPNDGTAILLNDRGNPTTSWTLACEYLTFKLKNRKCVPKNKTTYFVQSMPHVLRQYSTIIGLSGSLGSPAEREFLDRTYGAQFLEVPPFLSTCTKSPKHAPALVGGSVKVYARKADQREQTVQLALAKAAQVPVLIICEDAKGARDLHALVVARLQATAPPPVAAKADDLAQLFLMAESTRWATVVEQSTLPISVDARRYWRITVTDYFGGRGHDYRVRISDESVDKAGGLLVIMTTIPESQREWVQWRGRTARGDRRGQYAVCLSREDTFIAGQAQTIARRKASGDADNVTHTADLIDDLLTERDKATRSKLDSRKTQVRRGQVMNELCDLFYIRYPYSGTGWPAGVHVNLRDFLETWYSKNFEDAAAFAVQVQLATSVQAYAQLSSYTPTL